ncbi:MAG TPA: MerR family transcriptional regulator [Polyangia bacterium]|nr:MerR family transcriptional regulator [Polyangia bacterium]
MDREADGAGGKAKPRGSRRRAQRRGQAVLVPERIPDKAYFKIGEAARIVGVEPYVLRYWEQEFAQHVRPERSRTNQRLYRHSDVEAFLRIKALRYDERLAVAGTRKRLRVEQGAEVPPEVRRWAGALKREVEQLLQIIDDDERAE